MSLRCSTETRFRWVFADDDHTYDMAYADLVEGVFHIMWWVSDDENEEHKTGYFQGTVEEMKAYVIALVRLGAAE